MSIRGVSGIAGITPMYVKSQLQQESVSTEEEKEEQAKRFEKYDEDKSGGLDKVELSAMHTSMKNDLVARTLTLYEENAGGSDLNEEELANLQSDVLELFDGDGDGEVTIKELETGREKVLDKLEKKFGNVDIKSQINDIFNQSKTSLVDMMDSGKGSNANNGTFDFLRNNYNAQIQQYVEQAAKVNNSGQNNDKMDAFLDNRSIYELI